MTTEYTEKQKQEIIKAIRETEERLLRKVARRMRILSKDKKLKEQMEKEFYENYNLGPRKRRKAL